MKIDKPVSTPFIRIYIFTGDAVLKREPLADAYGNIKNIDTLYKINKDELRGTMLENLQNKQVYEGIHFFIISPTEAQAYPVNTHFDRITWNVTFNTKDIEI